MIRRDKHGKLITDAQTRGFQEFLLTNARIVLLQGALFSRADVLTQFGIVDEIANTLVSLSLVSNEPIKLVLHSPGGGLRSTYYLCDVIRTLGCPVYTINCGCASGAALILASGTAGHRYSYPNASIMLHLPESSFEGETRQMEIRTAEIRRLTDVMAERLIEWGAHKTKKQILKDIDREYWMSAKEAIEYGVVDQLVTKPLFQL